VRTVSGCKAAILIETITFSKDEIMICCHLKFFICFFIF